MQESIILDIVKKNNGYITRSELKSKNINPKILTRMVEKGLLERVDRGIYFDTMNDSFEDPYYIFQLRYPGTIYSHFTALHFHGMTEKIPYTKDITVANKRGKKNFPGFNVYYVSSKENLELGIEKVLTEYGNYVKCYDIERTICDIIKSIGRQDVEQVKKVLKAYSNSLNFSKIRKYAIKLNVYDKVMEYIGRYIE
ncbi:putative transcriptional regulator of viral defense system [Bacilli bacterium PM5-3]|nr:putative transcriptional regulator of viral defense system [Bacilli bacterium PM5-3]MDH6603833.1 putative transcriptional regulator of viral defense system [Bacilli bacterium PM5-9]